MQAEEEVELDGLRMVSKLRPSHPDIPLVVITMMTRGGMFHELCKLGVAAIVSKEEPASELAQISMRALISKETKTIVSPKIQMRLAREGSTTKDLAREQPLSPRELEVVRLFAQGVSVTEIARTLNRSVPTVATQKCARPCANCMSRITSISSSTQLERAWPDTAPHHTILASRQS